jgi:hypothetical protein
LKLSTRCELLLDNIPLITRALYIVFHYSPPPSPIAIRHWIDFPNEIAPKT